MNPIGFIQSAYTATNQIPKGRGAKHTAEGLLKILPQFADGLQDIEGFSHLFLIWVFHKTKRCELIGTPPLDDTPRGVFATRSPFRPNPIGLTVVKLLRREGSVLRLHGIDMLNGTPVLDIKPYLSSIPLNQLKRGWLAQAEKRSQ